jgi:hypothetical protein
MSPVAKAKASIDQGAADVTPVSLALERSPGEEAPVMLALDDLVRDQNGEVVLFNDSGLRALALSTSIPVIDEGTAGRHVTAAGENVSGFRYVAFANGLRLYHQQDLDLIVIDEPVPLD